MAVGADGTPGSVAGATTNVPVVIDLVLAETTLGRRRWGLGRREEVFLFLNCAAWWRGGRGGAGRRSYHDWQRFGIVLAI